MSRYGQRTLVGTNREISGLGKKPPAGSAYGTATGGIGAPTAVTINSVNYEYLTFNATGTLTVTTAGFFDYLAVGGGGGCAEVTHVGGYSAGGGGAGQVVFGSVYLSANQTITIGAGGAPWEALTAPYGASSPTTIAATSPFTQTALANANANLGNGQTTIYVGGGAGSINGGSAVAVFTETTAVGFRGGNATSGASNAGGGGGQSARGGNGSSTTGGSGGAGVDVSVFIGGSALFKAMGGGGGGTGAGGSAATNGVAGSTGTTPPDGNANSGGGGGGGVGNCTTGNGGSGIVYIRYTV